MEAFNIIGTIDNPEAFCRLVGEGCHDAHDRGEGFRKSGS